jgi:hypothetical protein
MKTLRRVAGIIVVALGGWIMVSHIISSSGSFVGIAIGAVVVYAGLFVLGANNYLRSIFGMKEKTREDQAVSTQEKLAQKEKELP